jgi:SAM-dependent methyltransferase
MKESEVICPICEANESWPIAGKLEPDVAAWRSEAGVTRPYSWQLCKTCGNGYPSEPPLPAVLDRYWQANRRLEGSAEVEAAVWQRRVSFSRVGADRSFKVFASLHRGAPGRFLDIACGLGETVRKFRDAGWQAKGIDRDVSTKPFHEKHQLRTKIGRFEDEPVADRYQMIHIAHAIYFISEPMAFLRRVQAELANDGLFGIVISDFLAAHAEGQPGYAHTFYPCAESMRYALALAGLEPFFSRRIGGDIYIAARPKQTTLPTINTQQIYRRYRTKDLRFALVGRPYLTARRLGKLFLKLVRSVA